MIINFISHLNPFEYSGGGEQITRIVIESGRKRGHDINVVSIDKPHLDYRKDAQMNMLWDVFNCPYYEQHFDFSAILDIARSKPYILGANGYEDICLLGTVPCDSLTDGRMCRVDISHNTFGEGGIGRQHPITCCAIERSILWKECRFSVFLSKHQLKVYEEILKVVKDPFVMLPPIQDLSSFYDRNLPRDIDVLSYGGHLEYKGFYNIMERFPDGNVSFIGGGDDSLIRKFKFGRLLGKIPYEEMPIVLSRARIFAHLPRWPEPFGMTTLQAYLCGCEMALNKYSDCIEGRTTDQIRKMAEQSRDCASLWDKIENELG